MDRIELRDTLKTICPNVYFQPPMSVVMKYPCIVYKLADINFIFADNIKFNTNYEYTVTVIDNEVDSPIAAAVAQLPRCIFQTGYVSDNLTHNVFYCT